MVGPLVSQDVEGEEEKEIWQNTDTEIESLDIDDEEKILKDMLPDLDKGLCTLCVYFPCLCPLRKLDLRLKTLRNLTSPSRTPPIPPPHPQNPMAPAQITSPSPHNHKLGHSGVTPPPKCITNVSPTMSPDSSLANNSIWERNREQGHEL